MEMQLRHYIWLVIGVGLAASLVDYTGLALVFQLPTMQRDLHVGNFVLEWMVLAGFITPGVLYMLVGKLCDKYGGFIIFFISCIFLLLGSVVMGLAFTGWMLVLGQFILGVGTGLVLPAAFVLIKCNSSSINVQRRGFIAFNAVFAVMSIIAVLCGVLFAQYLTWRLIYLVSFLFVLFGAIVVVCLRKRLDKKRLQAGLDYLGTVLLIIALGLILYAISRAQNHGFSLLNIILLVVGLVVLLIFLVAQAFVKDPLFKYSLYKDPRIIICILAMLLYTIPTSCFAYFFSLFTQSDAGLHYSAMISGLAYLPFQLTSLIVALLALLCRGNLVYVSVILCSAILAPISYLLFVVVPNSSFALLWWKLGLVAISFTLLGLVFPYAMSFVKKENAGEASSFFITLPLIVSTIGLAVGHNIYYGALQHAIGHYLANLGHPLYLTKKIVSITQDSWTQYIEILREYFSNVTQIEKVIDHGVHRGFFWVNIYQLLLSLIVTFAAIALFVEYWITRFRGKKLDENRYRDS